MKQSENNVLFIWFTLSQSCSQLAHGLSFLSFFFLNESGSQQQSLTLLLTLSNVEKHFPLTRVASLYLLMWQQHMVNKVLLPVGVFGLIAGLRDWLPQCDIGFFAERHVVHTPIQMNAIFPALRD